MPKEEKKVKNVKLTEEVMDALFHQAIESGFKNLQNYLEHILILQSKKK